MIYDSAAQKAQFKQFQSFCEDQAQQAPAPRTAANSKCAICLDSGYIRVEENGYELVKRCICQKEKVIAEAKEKANIPPKYRNITLEPISTDGRDGFRPYGGAGAGELNNRIKAEQAKVRDLCAELRDTYRQVFINKKKVDTLYGLMLYGDCGVGKTRMLSALLCDLIHMGLFDVMFVEYNELFKRIRFSYDSDELSYESIFLELTTAKVLLIDDFATDVSGNQAWILDNIGYIINERYTHNLPTLLTSNYWEVQVKQKTDKRLTDADAFEMDSHQTSRALRERQVTDQTTKFHKELKQRINTRLKSRIREMCYEVKMEGVDYRRRIDKNRSILYEKKLREKQRS